MKSKGKRQNQFETDGRQPNSLAELTAVGESLAGYFKKKEKKKPVSPSRCLSFKTAFTLANVQMKF